MSDHTARSRRHEHRFPYGPDRRDMLGFQGHRDTKEEAVPGYGVAHLDEIEEMHDGRCPFRPVRHHFGITTFGVTAWTGKNAGDRILNEHDEEDEFDELYLVLSGEARFEVGGDRFQARPGTFVRVP